MNETPHETFHEIKEFRLESLFKAKFGKEKQK